MTKLRRIEIDATPANIASMMERGQFHSHQDGQWRYSPYGGETVYVNDPTANFDTRAEFGAGVGAATCLSLGLFSRIHKDGTRGLCRWERNVQRMWDQYRPMYPEEAAQREWIAAQFNETKREAA